MPKDVRSIARSHTDIAIDTLSGVAKSSKNDSARVAAAVALLERGWGKSAQPHTGADGEDIRVTIRTIIEQKK